MHGRGRKLTCGGPDRRPRVPTPSMSESLRSVTPVLAPVLDPPEHRKLPAAPVALGYLAVALVPMAAQADGTPRFVALMAAHAVLVVALLLAVRAAGTLATLAAAWLPLIAIPLWYAELPYLIAAAGASFGDPLVQTWEQAMWGSHPARELAARAPSLWLSELLHLAYVSYYAIIYVPLAYLWLRDRRAFAEASVALVTTFVICFAVFVAFPVAGPRYLWPAPVGIPDGPIRGTVLVILERGSSRGAAFPSSHMAVAVVQALMALRWRLPGRMLVVAATLGIGMGAVYGGFHYAIDMVAGASLGVLVFVAVARRTSAWARSRIDPAPLP